MTRALMLRMVRWWLLACLPLGGCAVVKHPWERGHLAERCMLPGFGDSNNLKFRAHWEIARHGAEGGFGAAGGGCGCN